MSSTPIEPSNQASNCSGRGMTGIRSCTSATNRFGLVMSIVQESSRSFVSTFFHSSHSPAIVGRHLRRELQRRIVFDNGVVEASEPKMDEASTVHRVGVVRPEPERLVAIAEGPRKVAARYGARPATVVVSHGILRIEPDR